MNKSRLISFILLLFISCHIDKQEHESQYVKLTESALTSSLTLDFVFSQSFTETDPCALVTKPSDDCDYYKQTSRMFTRNNYNSENNFIQVICDYLMYPNEQATNLSSYLDTFKEISSKIDGLVVNNSGDSSWVHPKYKGLYDIHFNSNPYVYLETQKEVNGRLVGYSNQYVISINDIHYHVIVTTEDNLTLDDVLISMPEL